MDAADAPLEFPLTLLDDATRYMNWEKQVGQEEAKRQIEEATREHMRKYGNRSVLVIGEKMDKLSERIEIMRGEFANAD